MVQIRRTLHRPLSAIAGVQRPATQDAEARSAGSMGPTLNSALGTSGHRDEQSSGDPSDPPLADDSRGVVADVLAAVAPELQAESSLDGVAAAPPSHPTGKWGKQSADSPALEDSEWAVAAGVPSAAMQKPEEEPDVASGLPLRAALHQSPSWEEQSADVPSDLPSHEDALRRRRQARIPPKTERHGEPRSRQSREAPTIAQAKAWKQMEDD